MPAQALLGAAQAGRGLQRPTMRVTTLARTDSKGVIDMHVRHPVLAVASSVVTLALTATAAHAYLSSLNVDKCLAGKVRIVGKAAAAYTKCHSKNTAKPDAGAFGVCTAKAS